MSRSANAELISFFDNTGAAPSNAARANAVIEQT